MDTIPRCGYDTLDTIDEVTDEYCWAWYICQYYLAFVYYSHVPAAV